MPEYRLEERGPDHAKEFTATVFLGGEALGVGRGQVEEGSRAAGRPRGVRRTISERVRRRRGDGWSYPRSR